MLSLIIKLSKVRTNREVLEKQTVITVEGHVWINADKIVDIVDFTKDVSHPYTRIGLGGEDYALAIETPEQIVELIEKRRHELTNG